MLATLVQDVTTHHRVPLLITGALTALALAVLLVLAVRRLARRVPPGTPWWYYAGAAGGLAVSLNTSWRFFGDRLGVTGTERVVMFSVIELAFVACALGMRAGVRHIDPVTGRPGSAGAPRLVAWALCGLSGYAALVLSGPVEGVARVALGPVLSLVMLHLALGIEIRHRAGVRTGTWTRIAGELRERALSRLGLADDDRDAATRTRERAVTRAARLVLARRAPWRSARLARALRAAGVAHDPGRREQLLAELAVLRSAEQLATLPLRSPWTSTSTVSATAVSTASGTPDTTSMEDTPASEASTEALTESEPETQLVLDPPASDDTIAGGMLDGVVLAAHADDHDMTWSTLTKNAAVDLADRLLPHRTPRALVAALSQVDVTVPESTVRRRRAQRPRRARPTERILAGASTSGEHPEQR
jgi:hypothetical protein